MAWEGSDRKSRLPRDWAARRKRVLRMAGYACVECGAHANQVDHIKRDAGDGLNNLQALCEDCHGRKSSAEGNAARARRQRELKALTRRKRETHPGVIKGRPKPAERRGW